MGNILMCKSKKVYNIDTEEVYCYGLLPGYMHKNPCNETFNTWFKTRYSSNKNIIARQLKGVTFGQGKRDRINNITHALSLSDCYWVKDSSEKITFDNISPYIKKFWKGSNCYRYGSVPTLYLNGDITKEWITNEIMLKHNKDYSLELECSNLCKSCNIDATRMFVLGDMGLAVYNITNTNVMLEQANQSGRIDENNFSNNDIISLFRLKGVQMLTIDAIIGNYSRDTSNFGWLKDANDGLYITMAPLYGFGNISKTELVKDELTECLLGTITKLGNTEYINEVKRICNTVLKISNNRIFKERTKEIFKQLF